MRVTTVKAARQAAGICVACKEWVNPGQSYEWVRPYRSARRVKHASCRGWRRSELTANDKLSTLYAIQERLESSDATDLEDIATDLDDAVSEARDVEEEFRAAAEAIEEGFGHPVSQSEELESNADEIDGWCDELESAAEALREPSSEESGVDPEEYDRLTELASEAIDSLSL